MLALERPTRHRRKQPEVANFRAKIPRRGTAPGGDVREVMHLGASRRPRTPPDAFMRRAAQQPHAAIAIRLATYGESRRSTAIFAPPPYRRLATYGELRAILPIDGQFSRISTRCPSHPFATSMATAPGHSIPKPAPESTSYTWPLQKRRSLPKTTSKTPGAFATILVPWREK